MYEDPRSIFQKKIQNILKTEPDSINTPIEKLFTIHQLLLLDRVDESEKDNWKNLLEVYNIIGMQNFIKTVTLLRGKTLTLPTEEELKDSILTVLCYYYKEVEKKEWKEIIKLLDIPNLNTIKYGIHLRNLNTFINKKINAGELKCL